MHSVILHLTRGFLSTTNHLLSLQMRKYLSILDNPMLILRAKLIHGSVSLQSECKKHNLLRLRQKINICKILGASRLSWQALMAGSSSLSLMVRLKSKSSPVTWQDHSNSITSMKVIRCSRAIRHLHLRLTNPNS